ncbi:MAG: murein L,D-transpeptidase family protein [Candidatus Cloacimonadaceae bacterium]|nr:murein L,D-transpeptidase family protein [Candidatus Cloacimonadaceae bacterium]
MTWKYYCIPLMMLLLMELQCYAQSAPPTSARFREVYARIKPQLDKELAAKKLELGAPVYMRIFKSEKLLEVWLKKGSRYELFKTYSVCTYGSEGLGNKNREGDGRAPEGFYYITPSQMNPSSSFHLSFNLGFPNSYDRFHGKTGSGLLVHGKCVSIGCYAMTDKGIEEIYTLADRALRGGQSFFRVHIFPFRMTDANMRKHKDSIHYEFWQNLKVGYDFFVDSGYMPPNVLVRRGKYVFESR